MRTATEVYFLANPRTKHQLKVACNRPPTWRSLSADYPIVAMDVVLQTRFGARASSGTFARASCVSDQSDSLFQQH